MVTLPRFWRSILDRVTFAFQPIVDSRTGHTYGFEALLRGFDSAGFLSIPALFDAAFRDGVLYAVDRRLRERALTRFAEIPGRGAVRLFYNLDNRVTEMADIEPVFPLGLLDTLGIDPSEVVFEISERHEFSDYESVRTVLESYKDQGFSVALDDFGTGYSGLRLLYFAEPEFVKIDRFFIDGIDHSERKRMVVGQITQMANLMGLTIVAEGIETGAEASVCASMGCDLAQGFLFAAPSADLSSLKTRYGPETGGVVSAVRDANTGLYPPIAAVAPDPRGESKLVLPA